MEVGDILLVLLGISIAGIVGVAIIVFHLVGVEMAKCDRLLRECDEDLNELDREN